MMRSTTRWALGLLLTAAAGAAPVPFAHGSVELVADARAIAPAGSFDLGLRFQLEPGWHIYWQNPGDSGQPPRVSWQLPPGLHPGPLEWPLPQVLGTPQIVDYGYQNSVLLPVPVTVNGLKPGDLELAANLNLLICKNECVPVKSRVALTLPVGQPAPAPAATAHLFAAARAALPRPLPAGWKATASEDAKGFTLTLHAGAPLAVAHFFPLDDAQVDYSRPAQIASDAAGARLHLPKSIEDVKPSTHLRGVVALANGAAYVIDAPVSPGK